MNTKPLIRCSSLGRIMTDPVSIDPKYITPEVEAILAKKKREDSEKALIQRLKDKTLSEGAKTYLRELAHQEILGIDFTFSSKETEKGIEVEEQSIALLNRVRGLSLVKNTERRSNGLLTGECDLFDAERKRGHDIKSSWSAKTFPGWVEDCEDKVYEYQMRGYMMLWDADEWEVNYCLVDTPERLIGFEDMRMHIVSHHVPEHHRITSWVITRDAAKEALIREKVEAAQDYYAQAVREFDETHKPALVAA